MRKGDYLTAILRSNKTVFSTEDIALLWHESSSTAARVRLSYFVKNGDLFRIRRGLYAKSEDFRVLELATRIYVPSYISFETVLAREGMIFQYYDPIFVASYLKRDVVIAGQTYSFRRINYRILINSIGIEHVDETSISSKERAFLDTLYVNADYHFDNLRSLNWEKVFEILPIYNNKRMIKKTNHLNKERK